MSPTVSSLVLARCLPLAGVLCLLSCAHGPTAPDQNRRYGLQADYPLAWSDDGETIAFRRAFDSSYGPAGVYLISPQGGRPRRLYPADLFWPSNGRFSPDGRTLLIIDRFTLVLLDVATGAARQPMYTNSMVLSADWTPSGDGILYSRFHNDYPNVPEDSMYLHHLDLGTSTDTPVFLGGAHRHLNTIRRSPDGKLAVIWAVYQVGLLHYESSHLEIIYDNPANHILENLQWWVRPTRGTARLLYSLYSAGVVGEQLDVVGGRRAPFALGWHYTHLMSPTGNTLVVGGIDPVTRVGVLNLMSPDDISGASVRHLTTFSLP